jgi:hypothetical protein
LGLRRTAWFSKPRAGHRCARVPTYRFLFGDHRLRTLQGLLRLLTRGQHLLDLLLQGDDALLGSRFDLLV